MNETQIKQLETLKAKYSKEEIDRVGYRMMNMAANDPSDFGKHCHEAGECLELLVLSRLALAAELATAREACEQGRLRAENFLAGLRAEPEKRTAQTLMIDGMIQALQFDFAEALGIKQPALAAKGTAPISSD